MERNTPSKLVAWTYICNTYNCYVARVHLRELIHVLWFACARGTACRQVRRLVFECIPVEPRHTWPSTIIRSNFSPGYRVDMAGNGFYIPILSHFYTVSSHSFPFPFPSRSLIPIPVRLSWDSHLESHFRGHLYDRLFLSYLLSPRPSHFGGN